MLYFYPSCIKFNRMVKRCSLTERCPISLASQNIINCELCSTLTVVWSNWYPNWVISLEFPVLPGLDIPIDTFRLRQNGHWFPYNILKCIFLKEGVWILITKSLKFVPECPINNISACSISYAWISIRHHNIWILKRCVILTYTGHIFIFIFLFVVIPDIIGICWDYILGIGNYKVPKSTYIVLCTLQSTTGSICSSWLILLF